MPLPCALRHDAYHIVAPSPSPPRLLPSQHRRPSCSPLPPTCSEPPLGETAHVLLAPHLSLAFVLASLLAPHRCLYPRHHQLHTVPSRGCPNPSHAHVCPTAAPGTTECAQATPAPPIYFATPQPPSSLLPSSSSHNQAVTRSSSSRPSHHAIETLQPLR